MSAQDLEQRARELLAAELEAEGDQSIAIKLRRGDAGMDYSFVAAIRAIVAALRQQPAPVDLEQFRGAVRAIDDFVFHRERCGFPHQICDCGMKEARDRLLSIINAGKLCPCGEATCTESWEPGCGLGESAEHAVPAEREPPRGDELRAILARQPAPVVDDALRELIEADKEYDEARRWWDQECYTGLEGFSYETRVATADRFEEALARRAAALARAQGVQS